MPGLGEHWQKQENWVQKEWKLVAIQSDFYQVYPDIYPGPGGGSITLMSQMREE